MPKRERCNLRRCRAARARVRARTRKGALKCTREKVTLDGTRRSGIVAVEEATSETVSLTALLISAVPCMPRLPQCGSGRGSSGSTSTPTVPTSELVGDTRYGGM